MGLAPFSGFREEHFDFFTRPSAARRPSTQFEIQTLLVGAWEAIRERLTQDESTALGLIHTNPLAWEDSHAVAQANWEPEDRRQGRTNISIELWSDRLEVDLVGWTVNQAKLFEAWLAPRGIVGPEDRLDKYELSVWRRHPYNYDRKGDERPRYRPETPETYELATRLPLSAIRGQRIQTLLAQWRSEPDDAWEKLAYHLRRSWPRAQVVKQGTGLVPEMVDSVRELIPVVQRMSRGPHGRRPT
ncbi:MAG: hypothetical protein JO363_17910 [Solirubrobacterales bacterium]|nr:hypothetical protein [Solirubrobacterales bacterium]